LYWFGLPPLLCEDHPIDSIDYSSDMYSCNNHQSTDQRNIKVIFGDDYDSGVDSPRMTEGLINPSNINDLSFMSNQEVYEYYYGWATRYESLAISDNLTINKITYFQGIMYNDYPIISEENKRYLEYFVGISVFDVKGVMKKLGNMLGYYISRKNTHLNEARRTWNIIKELTEDYDNIVESTPLNRVFQHPMLDKYRAIGN
jgi:hypothetical protein